VTAVCCFCCFCFCFCCSCCSCCLYWHLSKCTQVRSAADTTREANMLILLIRSATGTRRQTSHLKPVYYLRNHA
jgi:hypothetical protein